MTKHERRSIWYIDAINLYGYAMIQKLPYNFDYITTTAEYDQRSISLYTILNTADDIDHGYYIVLDINYTNSCKDRTEQLALMPNKRKIKDNELGCIERERGCALGHPKGRARTQKLILVENNKT